MLARTTRFKGGAAFLLAASSLAIASLSAQSFNTNLLQNPGAEAAPPMTVQVPDWTRTSGNFTVVAYGTPGFPDMSSPGPTDRGSNFFSGGDASDGSTLASATQNLDLSFGTAAFSGGITPFTLSGYFGGYAEQNDNAFLKILFLNGSYEDLGSVSIGGVSAQDRGNVTGLLFRDTTGVIPVGTTQAIAELRMNKAFGNYNDGYADNLSFVIDGATTTTPEPSSMALFGTGLVGLVPMVRRRRNKK